MRSHACTAVVFRRNAKCREAAGKPGDAEARAVLRGPAPDTALRSRRLARNRDGELIFVKAAKGDACDELGRGLRNPRGTGPMIICSCNVLSDHDVRSIVAAPHAPRTPAQVHRCLGCVPECGRCSPTIRRIVSDALTRDDAIDN